MSIGNLIFFAAMNSTTAPIIIYTDGSSRGNPGRGGYGAILMWGSKTKEISQGFELTTNNRMELSAVIAAIESLKRSDIPIVVYTDSKYVVDAITKGWLNNWIKTNFSGGKKNKDLWTKYYQLSRQLDIKFSWVKGHADNVYNNRCDELATAAADGKNLIKDIGFEE